MAARRPLESSYLASLDAALAPTRRRAAKQAQA
jgi:hypothetical protein